MRIYTLNLSSFPNQIISNQTISVLDTSNPARVKWFIGWNQFFKVEDLGKACKVKAKLITEDLPIASLTHITNLGFLSVSIGSVFGNSIDGMVLGMTKTESVPNDTARNYLAIDTTQSCGVSAFVPTSGTELVVSFRDINGNQQTNIPDYIFQLIFEIEE